MNHCIRTPCPMCSIASATLLSMSSSALHSIFSRAERACFPPLSPCAVIKALMTSSQPSFSGSFDNHSLMYSMLFKVTHNWEILIENTKTSYLKGLSMKFHEVSCLVIQLILLITRITTYKGKKCRLFKFLKLYCKLSNFSFKRYFHGIVFIGITIATKRLISQPSVLRVYDKKS